MGGAVHDVAEWICGALVSRPEAREVPPRNVVLGAAPKNVIAERASHGLLFATHGTERWIDDDGSPIHVLEDEPVAVILFVGSTTEPGPAAVPLDAESGTVLETLFAGQRRGPRINGDAIHSTCPPGRARILDSVVRDITPHTRPLRQARLRVKELATANRRKDEFLAMLSPELRNPLAAIQNAVRLLSAQTGETSSRQNPSPDRTAGSPNDATRRRPSGRITDRSGKEASLPFVCRGKSLRELIRSAVG
jgi:signal transduction histidine kinase